MAPSQPPPPTTTLQGYKGNYSGQALTTRGWCEATQRIFVASGLYLPADETTGAKGKGVTNHGIRYDGSLIVLAPVCCCVGSQRANGVAAATTPRWTPRTLADGRHSKRWPSEYHASIMLASQLWLTMLGLGTMLKACSPAS
jgi:hypothetical protein